MQGATPNVLLMLQRAFAAHQAGDAADAERLYRDVIRAAPEQFDALHLLGVLKASGGHYEEADGLINKALRINPGSAEALNNRANVLWSLDRLEEALTSCEKALAIKPDYAEALNNRGNILNDLGRFEAALASYDRALALRPDYANALANRADVLRDLQRPEEALAGYDRALAIRPTLAKALVNRAIVLQDLRRYDAALASYEQAVKIDPGDAKAYHHLGTALHQLRRFEPAARAYRRAFELDPLRGTARSLYVLAKRQICDWATAAEDEAGLAAAVGSGAVSVLPLVVISTIDDPAIQLEAARRYVADNRFDRQSPLPSPSRMARDKIRIAYVSADFRDHTMSVSLAQLFELHDRGRYETYGISLGPDDGSDLRKRVMGSLDHFLDVRAISDLEAARQIQALGIDIAVDLAGFTEGCRPGILAHRPAPIQVNYLGYVGTMGADFIDYIFVDPVLVPPDQRAFFAEKLVHLPECYLPSDTTRAIAEPGEPRSAYGLPDRGFVFACFNNSYKITSPVFALWMRLLQAVESAVLWVRSDNELVMKNLRSEAEARGVAPDRVIQAGRCPLPEHLARFRLADLFLDTLPYTAHSTAVDALWGGLPVLTCAGRSYAARSAASLLTAIGLPELVTSSLDEYEALALKLARDPGVLAGLRERLARNRATMPLFDTPRLCRHIESAYEEMHARWMRGEPARPFSVPALPT
ncbi:MAG TPA: tetratricopeptide repeat protein [Stellaceae bacterium]|nr:tetratricopeptide repeat protein [Stellaceae bacterium]